MTRTHVFTRIKYGMPRHLTLWMFAFWAFSTLAQSDIQHIGSVYQMVEKRIADCEEATIENMPCGLYKSSIVTNANQQPWRAVGNYQRFVTFWHTDDPNMADRMMVNPGSMLQKVTVRIASTYTWYEEFLFEDGELIFYYKTYHYGDEPKQEYKFYFKNGQLIKYIENTQNAEDPENTKADSLQIQTSAERLIHVFTSAF